MRDIDRYGIFNSMNIDRDNYQYDPKGKLSKRYIFEFISQFNYIINMKAFYERYKMYYK